MPSRFYGDPSNNVEEVTKLKVVAAKQDEKMKMNKSRRIKLLVRNVMNGKNKGGGRER